MTGQNQPTPDLELFSTDELVKELCRRFDVAAFVGKRVGDQGPTRDTLLRVWHGDEHEVIGLAEDLKLSALETYWAGEVDLEGDDAEDDEDLPC